jgi:hypothetical protein
LRSIHLRLKILFFWQQNYILFSYVNHHIMENRQTPRFLNR